MFYAVFEKNQVVFDWKSPVCGLALKRPNPCLNGLSLIGHLSWALQHRSVPWYIPISLWFVAAILPTPHHWDLKKDLEIK